MSSVYIVLEKTPNHLTTTFCTKEGFIQFCTGHGSAYLLSSSFQGHQADFHQWGLHSGSAPTLGQSSPEETVDSDQHHVLHNVTVRWLGLRILLKISNLCEQPLDLLPLQSQQLLEWVPLFWPGPPHWTARSSSLEQVPRALRSGPLSQSSPETNPPLCGWNPSTSWDHCRWAMCRQSSTSRQEMVSPYETILLLYLVLRAASIIHRQWYRILKYMETTNYTVLFRGWV